MPPAHAPSDGLAVLDAARAGDSAQLSFNGALSKDAAYTTAGIQAALDSAEVLIPGIFVVLVTWLGAASGSGGRALEI